MPTPTEVMAHAEAVALFVRTALLEGMPPSYVGQTAASYAYALVLQDKMLEQPRYPWDEEEEP